MRRRLTRDVEFIAGVIGPRNVTKMRSLEEAGSYIDATFLHSGYPVTSQFFDAAGERVRNIGAEIRGETRPDEIVVVGAHYDTVDDTPGADDNASGVAALLELSRRFEDGRFARTLRLVSFVNEEPPYFQTEAMGSWFYARRARAGGEKIVAMLALESIGYFSDAPESQTLPVPLPGYPTTGNFVGFVSNLKSAPLLRRVVRTFRAHSAVPAESLAAPSVIPGIGYSDQWSFWQEGFPAVMVTGTAMFRNPNYHRPTDLPQTLDYHRLTGVVIGLNHVVRHLLGTA